MRGVMFAKMQRRLVFGQLGLWVGLAVLISLVGLPDTAKDGRIFDEWVQIALFLSGFVLVSLPFDYVGGFWLWRKFGRIPPQTPTTYIRSLITHTVLYQLIALAFLIVGQAQCLSAILALVMLISFAQIEWQDKVAQLVGGLRPTQRDLGAETRLLRRQNLEIGNVQVMQATDPAFMGGLSGRPGHAQLVLPAAWFDEAGSPYTARQMIRRASVLRDGSRNRALAIALLSNVGGVVLCSLLPNVTFATGDGVIMFMLAFTLWSTLLQMTLLPLLSRRAVAAADYFAAKKGLPKRQLKQTFETSGALISADFTFPYPIPDQAERLEQLASHQPPVGAWHVQHMTLYLSWSCLGLLSRSLWCIGRPQLWVMGIAE